MRHGPVSVSVGVSKRLRFEVLTRDGYRCRYCGAPAERSVLHVDHVVARASGGSDLIENLVTACEDCNLGKSDRKILGLPEGFFIESRRRASRKVPVPAKLARQYAEPPVPAPPPPIGFVEHELWCWEVDSLDEIDDDCQLALVWCETHQRYEWHNLPQRMIGTSAVLHRRKRANWRGDM